MSYQDLSAEADILARRLAGAGVDPGDRVAALLPNRPFFVVLVHAAARIGATLVPLNTRLTPDELAWQIADAQPRLVLADESLLDRVAPIGRPGSGLADVSPKGIVQSGAARTDPAQTDPAQTDPARTDPAHTDPAQTDRAQTDRAQTDPAQTCAPPLVVLVPPHTGAGPAAGTSDSTHADLAGAPHVTDLPLSNRDLLESVSPDAPQAIIYTSGTSGRPKGAVLTHGALAWSAAASALRLGVAPNDRWLLPLPMFHVGGLAAVLRCAWYGTAASLPESFEPSAMVHELQSGQVTLASVVPTMLARVLDAWGDAPVPPELRAILLGGGPVSDELLARATTRGIPVAMTYGLTEAASQVATAVPTRSPRLADGLPPLPFTEISICDEEGLRLPCGTVGEIAVRSPSVTAGYWKDMHLGRATTSDDWLRTGDGGFLDDVGNLHVVGRRADLIVTGGENVYPAEVEAALDEHPSVVESCVIGVPDAEWGSRVVAVLVSRSGVEATGSDLDAFARKRLAGFKVPREVVWRGQPLPRTAAGKLQRAKVREDQVVRTNDPQD